MENEILQNNVSFASGDNIREYYKLYLSDMCELSVSSVGHYLNSLNQISRFLKKMGLIKKDIYEVGSLEQLDIIWESLNKEHAFLDLNQRGHRMYSAGYKRYREFIAGQDFLQYRERLDQLDVPMSPSNPTIIEYKIWKRSGILRTQVIAATNYTCEMDATHVSFLTESMHKPYMEAHHIVPIRLQGNFKNSLDVYANIICLCPLCHRKIHYGITEERREMVDEIYENRKERFLHSGFTFSKSEFERIILNAS